MGFASPLTHTSLPTVAPEREALEAWLDYYRVELLTKLTGLDDEQAARRVLPSLTTLHGLVRHLTKVEHAWFVTVLAGLDDPAPFGWPAVTDGDFRLDDSDGLAADVQRYVDACERSRQILAGLSLDDVGVHWRLGTVDARWVMLHMIEEYAQHNGHADIIRELIDGTTQS
ncbi:MAG TPA: DinB family protein [Streptosporangiaceae bacterium]|jgi:uncharacterized damage-inducible protein DinB|nr:DinB family protein [Streptosporangiaceae bacterium]